MTMFAARTGVEQVELGHDLAPRFDAEGLMPAIVVNADDQMVLMLGYMNKIALKKTIETGEAYYWSRSKKSLEFVVCFELRIGG